jgi:hypothetical protein
VCDVTSGIDRGDELAVGRPRDDEVPQLRADTSQLAHERPAGRVPDLDGAIATSGHELRAVGAVQGLVDRVAVKQGEHPPVRSRIPDLRSPVISRNDLSTVGGERGRPDAAERAGQARLLC